MTKVMPLLAAAPQMPWLRGMRVWGVMVPLKGPRTRTVGFLFEHVEANPIIVVSLPWRSVTMSFMRASAEVAVTTRPSSSGIRSEISDERWS